MGGTQKLSVVFSGDLDVRRNSACCPGGAIDGGCSIKLSLANQNQCADAEISQIATQINATGIPGGIPLPYPTGLLQGRVLVFTVLQGGPMTLAVTLNGIGDVVLPIEKTLVYEPAYDNYITGLTVTTGQGFIEWAVTGTEV